MIKNIFVMFFELLQAVVEKVEEWSREPLFWAYAIGALFAFLMFSQGWWLAGWIVLALTLLIEKRNPTKRAADGRDSSAKKEFYNPE